MSDVHVRHDFYPRSPCGERRAARFTPTASRNFYPRSPCGERLSTSIIGFSGRVFLSTLSLRRATRWARSRRRRSSDFYPRSPCGERRQGHLHAGNLRHFYPRSPCGERPTAATPILKSPYFYPRSPCGERLYDTYAKVLRVNISIHALLAESDNNINSSVNTADQISIHALLAESDIRNSPALLGNTQFLSTLSLRRAT